FSTAGLVTRMTTDVTNIQNAYQMILRMFTRAPASMICAMVMAFTINARLACIYLVAVIILGILLFLIMSHATKYFQQAFPKYDDLNESVQENVSAIRVVKAYVREEQETSKLRRASENIYNIFVKAETNLVFNAPMMQTAVYTCILLVSWFGAKMIASNSLTTGELMSLLTYCMNILMSLMMLSMVFIMITMSMASAKRISEVLNETSDLKNPEHPFMKVEDGSIEFRHVDFAYKKDSDEPVLEDIDLKIRSGETIGIIGGTGSAKTSLVNLISRLYDVTKGEVLVGGKNVKDYDMEVLRNQVSVVLQNNVLFSGTILDNLRWGDKEATLEECRHACELACADEFIDRFPKGYETYIEQGGSNVSGGQKQRLCIARALLKKPKVLILDDSTSAVDTATDAKIRRAFREEIPDTTKLIIAQRISSVQDADRIIVMEDGKVNGFGTHEELLEQNDIYREVYESQTSGGGDFDEKEGE
uniref:ABC transporter ATP-binding protein n=2 Tax=Lachnospiraceae TaxID=186803 RepID=UPI00189B1DCF